MANEFQISVPIYTGQTLYALRRNATAQIWNGADFVDYETADYADYPLTMSEQGTASGYFVGDDPADLTPGSVVAKIQVGGSPAESDPDAGSGAISEPGGGGGSGSAPQLLLLRSSQ